MTWPDGIALAVGLTTLALLLTHQHLTASHTDRADDETPKEHPQP